VLIMKKIELLVGDWRVLYAVHEGRLVFEVIRIAPGEVSTNDRNPVYRKKRQEQMLKMICNEPIIP